MFFLLAKFGSISPIKKIKSESIAHKAAFLKPKAQLKFSLKTNWTYQTRIKIGLIKRKKIIRESLKKTNKTKMIEKDSKS